MIYDIQTLIQGVSQDENDPKNLLPYLKVLKYIMGADGVIAEAEWKAFQEEVTHLKVPDDIVQELVDFEIETAELEAILPPLKKDSYQARLLLRDGIHIAMADGVYAPEEKDAVHQAGKLLGVPKYIVSSLEALVEMEYAATHLREALI